MLVFGCFMQVARKGCCGCSKADLNVMAMMVVMGGMVGLLGLVPLCLLWYKGSKWAWIALIVVGVEFIAFICGPICLANMMCDGSGALKPDRQNICPIEPDVIVKPILGLSLLLNGFIACCLFIIAFCP